MALEVISEYSVSIQFLFANVVVARWCHRGPHHYTPLQDFPLSATIEDSFSNTAILPQT